MVKNAWGKKVPELKNDPWYVPPEDRLKEDDPEDFSTNALEGGDDLDGWTPEDGPPTDESE